MIPARASWTRSAQVLVFYGAMGAAALVWSTVRGHPNPWSAAGQEPKIILGAAVGIALGAVIVVLSRVATARLEWARQLHTDLRALLGPLSGIECALLAAASSLGEELFFRGAMLPVVGPWWQALIFAGIHIGRRRSSWPWTASAFVAGLLFGQMFLAFGDLTGPVLAHFIVNFLNLRHLSRTELQ